MPARGIASAFERKWRLLRCCHGRGVWRAGAFLHRRYSPWKIANRSPRLLGSSSGGPAGSVIDYFGRSAFGGGGVTVASRRVSRKELGVRSKIPLLGKGGVDAPSIKMPRRHLRWRSHPSSAEEGI